ncbi:MAG: phytanoyl-CoA dioxygenase family protein [Pseudomonadota bacterium]
MPTVRTTTTFAASAVESTQGCFEAEKLQAILQAISVEGYAVVGDLVSGTTCAELLATSLEDAEQVRASQAETRHERRTGRGHLQLGLRRHAPYVSAELVANPLTEQIVTGLLGQDAWLGFYNGNVNLPGSGYQPLHYDRPFSWRTPEAAAHDGQPWPPPTTTLSCSLALTHITEANGAAEIYPGSHLETAVTQWPEGERVSKHPELIEQRGEPSRMIIPGGGICFRDPRMWHRGVPNPGEQARPMIALTYHAARCLHWRGRLIHDLDPQAAAQCAQNVTLKVMDDGTLDDGRLVFDADTEAAFRPHSNPHGINRNVRFVQPPQRVNHFVDAHTVGGARVVDDGRVQPLVELS